MASIVKRKSKYSVVYTYKDDKGEGMAQLDKLVGCEQIKRQI